MTTDPQTDRYRKKPISVEARRVPPSSDGQSGLDLAAWCGGSVSGTYAEPKIFVPTLKGELVARVGDWIVKGTRGEFWPVRGDIFTEDYEPAVSSSLPDRAADRDRIAEALAEATGDRWPAQAFLTEADAVLGVLPPPTDRATVLHDAERTMLTYALDQAQERIWSEDGFTDEDQAAVDSLRRLAAGRSSTQTPAAPTKEA
ncbi:hypothetical protein ACIREM_32870 [Streptomyces shenzhenensis]|uniref:hypothetical protein n=1 Tax=Streptomyces shenzhenensis TaxID=943815 RepID=UPI00382D32F2